MLVTSQQFSAAGHISPSSHLPPSWPDLPLSPLGVFPVLLVSLSWGYASGRFRRVPCAETQYPGFVCLAGWASGSLWGPNLHPGFSFPGKFFSQVQSREGLEAKAGSPQVLRNRSRSFKNEKVQRRRGHRAEAALSGPQTGNSPCIPSPA